MRTARAVQYVVGLLVGSIVYFATAGSAWAIPSFARKYQTSCQTCHTIYPVLNPFGEAFRRNGYRFPSQNDSVDSDAVKAPTIPLGQEEYTKTFPNSVWPDKIVEAVPLSMWLNGGLTVNMPDSAAQQAAGNTFTWSGILAEAHIFAAGAFNDTLTYMTQLTLESDFGSPPGTFDIETAYLLWNDVVGPRHWFNVWVGRLWAPQLTSFGLHTSYLNDTVMPAVSAAGLYNPSASFTLGHGHTDGVELNGIIAHRFDYALGWVASSSGVSGAIPNAEDVYAHIGIKSGGVALDGEGKYGPNVPDPRKPWAEKSITLDLFAYHGLTRMDNGTGVPVNGSPTPTGQDDRFNAAGAVAHGQWDSLILMAGAQVERHDRPYPGSAATMLGTSAVPGVPDLTNATSLMQYDEVEYVVFPWLIPGVRVEYTYATVESNPDAQLLRIVPGVATLLRPNIKFTLTADLEWGKNLPPVGGWSTSGAGSITPTSGSKFEAQQINGSVGVAF